MYICMAGDSGEGFQLFVGNMKEITYKELLKLPRDSYTLVDTRDEGSTQYGTIPGSLHIEA